MVGNSFHDVNFADEKTFQVVRLRRAMSIRLRAKSTKEEQQPSCKYSKPRWDIILFLEIIKK